MCKTVLATMLVLAAAMLPAAQAPAPVAGVVFEDANGNGRRDLGERGLAGVSVSNQHEVVESGPDGAYRLASPGYGVVFVSVPNDHRAAGPFWKAVPGSVGATVDFALAARPGPTTFTFIHASDTHVSKESLGRLQEFRSIAEARRPDFILVTGDLVRDALRVGEAEARGYFNLFLDEARRFSAPIWSVPGNHENFGIERHLSLVSPTHPLYRQGDVPAAARAELLLVHLWRGALRRAGLGRYRRPLVSRPRGRGAARVAAPASPRGTRGKAAQIFKRRALTASGATLMHFRPMARAR